MSNAAALSRTLGPLRRAVLRATRLAEDLPDLPETHIEVLRTVADTPGLGPPAIAEHLRLARPTVSNLMKTMQRAHLIELTRDVDDARRVHVTATATALELLRRYDGNVADVSRELGKHRAAVWRWIKKFGLGPSKFRRTE